MTSRPASEFGKRPSRTRNLARSVSVGADRLGRARLRRQRGRRLQRRQGPYVRARREDRQDRLGVLSGSQDEGDIVRGPLGKSPLDAATWKNATGIPISGGGTWTSYTLDPKTGLLYVPGGNPGSRLRHWRARGRQFLYRLGRRARRQDWGLQKSFQACAEGLARLGRLQPADPDSNDGRQAAYGGRAEGRIPLRLRSRRQQRALQRSRYPDRGCRRNLFARRPSPFLPGRGGGRGMEQPGLRSADEPRPRRRSRVVRHGNAEEMSRTATGEGRAALGRDVDVEPIQHVRPLRQDTGRGGFTPSTPTPASGSGA